MVSSELISIVPVIPSSKDGGQQKEGKHNDGENRETEFQAELGRGLSTPLGPERVLIIRYVPVGDITLDTDHYHTVRYRPQ